MGQGGPELRFRDQGLVVGGWKPFAVECTTIEIGTSYQGVSDSLLGCRSIVVVIIDISW